ncbi:MAG TPA: arsenate reductase (glutaredoxin) [Rhodospirillaceae bacterium]|nr:arsenate reductase (glutaredoxin) [Rhodospirillaceae bacterium]
MSITIYHNPKCSKSRQTLALLRDKGYAPEVVDYLRTPPSAAQLKEILRQLGMAPRDLLRRKEADENGVDPMLPDDQLIAAMVAHPIVIERPIVLARGQARIGRPPEAVLEIL